MAADGEKPAQGAKLWHKLAVAVAVLGVSLAVVGKAKPELFLQLPSMGFVLYAVLGGKHVPPYFDNAPFSSENFRKWARDGDVIVATGAKCGTTWLCYCSHAVRTKGADSPNGFEDIMYSTPWMEFIQTPGETFEERLHLYNTTVLPSGKKLRDYWDHPSYPFRIFKSHYTPDSFSGGDPFQNVLPVRKHEKVKYIVASRNGKEVARSMHSFFQDVTPEFRTTWGGFPLLYDSAESLASDLLPGGVLYSLYFAHVNAWWPLRRDPNVLLLHYADMTRDGRALVAKLADFLGVSLTEEERGKVEKMCSMAHMKEHGSYFDYKQPLRADGQAVFFPQSFIKSGGKSGKASEAKFSPEFQKKWDSAVLSEFPDPEQREWAANGGGF